MKKIILQRLSILAFAVAASSCAYDPYYSSSSIGYSSGYGDGYGYGGSSFTTSYFVSTGDPRWGYDPYCHSYYDYRSRRYYDPYLYGYYPMGYRPVAVVGVPHPYGWRQGSRHCPPPRNVRNITVVNYRDRERAYRNSNYSWASQVRHQEGRGSRSDGYRSGDRQTRDYRNGDRQTRDYRSGDRRYDQSDSIRRMDNNRQPAERSRYGTRSVTDVRQPTDFVPRDQSQTRNPDFRGMDRRGREPQIQPSSQSSNRQFNRIAPPDVTAPTRQQRQNMDSGRSLDDRRSRQEQIPQMKRQERRPEPSGRRDERRDEPSGRRDERRGDSERSRGDDRELRSLGEG